MYCRTYRRDSVLDMFSCTAVLPTTFTALIDFYFDKYLRYCLIFCLNYDQYCKLHSNPPFSLPRSFSIFSDIVVALQSALHIWNWVIYHFRYIRYEVFTFGPKRQVYKFLHCTGSPKCILVRSYQCHYERGASLWKWFNSSILISQ